MWFGGIVFLKKWDKNGGFQKNKNTRENIGNVESLTEIRLVEIWVRKCFGCEMTIKRQNRVILLEIKKYCFKQFKKI